MKRLLNCGIWGEVKIPKERKRKNEKDWGIKTGNKRRPQKGEKDWKAKMEKTVWMKEKG